MKIDRFLKAALVGLTLSVSAYAVTAPTVAVADNLRVVKSGTSSRLQVPLNRAIVVQRRDRPVRCCDIGAKAGPCIGTRGTLCA